MGILISDRVQSKRNDYKENYNINITPILATDTGTGQEIYKDIKYLKIQ